MSNKISPVRFDCRQCNGLAIYRSAQWELAFTISERDNLTDTPLDLSGYTGKCQIKYSLTDDTPIAECSVDTYADGTVVIGLGAEYTKNIICPGKTFRDVLELQYECILIDNETDEVFRTLYGTVEVVPSAFDESDN